MASGNGRTYRGSFTGTGSDKNIDIVGFRPTVVRLYNVAAPDEAYWQSSMADDSMFKRVAAGTLTLVTSNGVTPRANGFAIGADSDINVATQVVHFYCED